MKREVYYVVTKTLSKHRYRKNVKKPVDNIIISAPQVEEEQQIDFTYEEPAAPETIILASDFEDESIDPHLTKEKRKRKKGRKKEEEIKGYDVQTIIESQINRDGYYNVVEPRDKEEIFKPKKKIEWWVIAVIGITFAISVFFFVRFFTNL